MPRVELVEVRPLPRDWRTVQFLRQALHIAQQIADALDAAHERYRSP